MILDSNGKPKSAKALLNTEFSKSIILKELTENNDSITIKHKFKVDKQQRSNKMMYDMIIGNDLMWNIGVDIFYHTESIKWNNKSITLKRHSTIQDSYMFNTLYDIHTASPIIKEAGE